MCIYIYIYVYIYIYIHIISLPLVLQGLGGLSASHAARCVADVAALVLEAQTG